MAYVFTLDEGKTTVTTNDGYEAADIAGNYIHRGRGFTLAITTTTDD